MNGSLTCYKAHRDSFDANIFLKAHIFLFGTNSPKRKHCEFNSLN